MKDWLVVDGEGQIEGNQAGTKSSPEVGRLARGEITEATFKEIKARL